MSLRTDYVNAELNTEVNANTKYEMTENQDGSVSFTDVSVYSVTGDTFGAGDLNTTNTEVNRVATEVSKLETQNTLSLAPGSWSNSAPYTQTVNLARITSSDKPIISMGTPSTISSANYKAMKKAYGYIDRVVSNNGSLTFYCYNKKPTVQIRVLVKGV